VFAMCSIGASKDVSECVCRVVLGGVVSECVC